MRIPCWWELTNLRANLKQPLFADRWHVWPHHDKHAKYSHIQCTCTCTCIHECLAGSLYLPWFVGATWAAIVDYLLQHMWILIPSMYSVHVYIVACTCKGTCVLHVHVHLYTHATAGVEESGGREMATTWTIWDGRQLPCSTGEIHTLYMYMYMYMYIVHMHM